MRIALFGGSFDPPHRGHVAIARAAADALELDCVLWAPTGLQPLKLDGATASYADRLAMTTLAAGLDPRFRSSDMDAPRLDGRPNYTVETLERMRERWPEAEPFGILGADSFAGFPQWHEADRLLTLAEWIVVSRPGVPLGKAGEHVHLVSSVQEEVSATELRRRLRLGEDCYELMPEPVLQYVREHGLYRERAPR